jgi:transposase-like protein
LAIIGVTPDGKKELVALADGLRKSTQWRDLLLNLKRRGLAIRPELAVGDGALGFWKALHEVWPKTRAQRQSGYRARRGSPLADAPQTR